MTGLTLVLEHLPAGTLCSHLRKQKTLSPNRQPVLTESAAAALLLPIAQVSYGDAQPSAHMKCITQNQPSTHMSCTSQNQPSTHRSCITQIQPSTHICHVSLKTHTLAWCVGQLASLRETCRTPRVSLKAVEGQLRNRTDR
jgi:hypothetical protein